jgi:hypothetical protein
MSDPKRVALKLMGVLEQCQHCTHWTPKTVEGTEDWGECSEGEVSESMKALGRDEIWWGSSCDKFFPRPCGENPDHD